VASEVPSKHFIFSKGAPVPWHNGTVASASLPWAYFRGDDVVNSFWWHISTVWHNVRMKKNIKQTGLHRKFVQNTHNNILFVQASTVVCFFVLHYTVTVMCWECAFVTFLINVAYIRTLCHTVLWTTTIGHQFSGDLF